MRKIRVLLVDDHTLVRQGMRRLLETDPEVEVVGEAGDGNSAIRLVQELAPDVTVMDIAIPEMDGIEATRAITTSDKNAKVLILTMNTDDVAVRRSLKAGARGYLLKDSEDLVRAVKQIARGQSFFSPAAARLLSGDYVTNGGGGKQIEDNLHRLTERELEVLGLVGKGLSNKEIATHLGITERTARTHVSNILGKLDLQSRTQAALYAVERKLVH